MAYRFLASRRNDIWSDASTTLAEFTETRPSCEGVLQDRDLERAWSRACVCEWQVYLPMSYVWGVRGTAKHTPLTDALRQELYVAPYDSIDWDAARNQCAKPDLYYPHPKVQVLPEACAWPELRHT
jgi:hypothetical protein